MPGYPIYFYFLDIVIEINDKRSSINDNNGKK